MTGHLSPAQVELIDIYDAGEMTDIAFTAAALEAGISQARIDGAIRERLVADRIAAEEHREERLAGSQFGMGA